MRVRVMVRGRASMASSSSEPATEGEGERVTRHSWSKVSLGVG